MNERIFFGMIGMAIFFVGLLVGIVFATQNETSVQVNSIDYSDRFDGLEGRFDRVEAGITNSVVDVCFQWGGQWVADEQNELIVQDVGGLQGILCIKPPQPA